MTADKSHPFYAFTAEVNGKPIYLCSLDAGSRVQRVKGFDVATCERALKLPDLQKTVRIAIERRLRKLQKQPRVTDRLAEYAAYVERWKASGRRTLILKTPCCNGDLEVPSQDRDDGRQWDSLVSCPHCGELFMKIVTFAHAEGRLPRVSRRT